MQTSFDVATRIDLERRKKRRKRRRSRKRSRRRSRRKRGIGAKGRKEGKERGKIDRCYEGE